MPAPRQDIVAQQPTIGDFSGAGGGDRPPIEQPRRQEQILIASPAVQRRILQDVLGGVGEELTRVRPLIPIGEIGTTQALAAAPRAPVAAGIRAARVGQRRERAEQAQIRLETRAQKRQRELEEEREGRAEIRRQRTATEAEQAQISAEGRREVAGVRAAEREAKLRKDVFKFQEEQRRITAREGAGRIDMAKANREKARVDEKIIGAARTLAKDGGTQEQLDVLKEAASSEDVAGRAQTAFDGAKPEEKAGPITSSESGEVLDIVETITKRSRRRGKAITSTNRSAFLRDIRKKRNEGKPRDEINTEIVADFFGEAPPSAPRPGGQALSAGDILKRAKFKISPSPSEVGR